MQAERLAKTRPPPTEIVPEAQLKAEAERLSFATYRDDPTGFSRDVLGLLIWERQREILDAVGAPEARVAVRSGHKVGKTTAAVAIALWFACTRARALVVVTATNYEQVKTVFWRELGRVLRDAPGREDILRQVVGSRVNLDPGTGMRFVDGRVILGIATDTTEGMAGFSSPELLFVVDEASGVAPGIFEAIEGNRAGGARIVMFGNPTQASGVFFDAFHEKRDFWKTIHVSSEDTPNVTGVGPRVPGLAEKSYVEEKRREWGIDSPSYQVRIAGNFASQASNAVVGLATIDAARTRRKKGAQPRESDRLEFGVDVARFGDDDSVILPRRGAYAYAPIVVHGLDTVQVAGKVLETARAMVRKDDAGKPAERARVKVDVIGVGGGVADHLRQHKDLIELVEVNASERASAEDEYPNLRSQLWFAVAAWLEAGGTFEADGALESELLAAKYSFDTRGRRKVEAKDEIKKRIGRSPDRADALALAVYSPRVGGRGGAVRTGLGLDESPIY